MLTLLPWSNSAFIFSRKDPICEVEALRFPRFKPPPTNELGWGA